MRTDRGAVGDAGAGLDHGECADRHASAELRLRIDRRAGVDTHGLRRTGPKRPPLGQACVAEVRISGDQRGTALDRRVAHSRCDDHARRTRVSQLRAVPRIGKKADRCLVRVRQWPDAANPKVARADKLDLQRIGYFAEREARIDFT